MTNAQINCAITDVVGVDRHYVGSLDAMHEAEKVLTSDQHILYSRQLAKFSTFRVDVSAVSMGIYDLFVNCIHATAAQRAEAFLKTLNLWKDE